MGNFPALPSHPYTDGWRQNSVRFRHQTRLWRKRKTAAPRRVIYGGRWRRQWERKEMSLSLQSLCFRKRPMLPNIFFTLPPSLPIRNSFRLIFRYPEMVKENTIFSFLPVMWFNKHLFSSWLYQSLRERKNRTMLRGRQVKRASTKVVGKQSLKGMLTTFALVATQSPHAKESQARDVTLASEPWPQAEPPSFQGSRLGFLLFWRTRLSAPGSSWILGKTIQMFVRVPLCVPGDVFKLLQLMQHQEAFCSLSHLQGQEFDSWLLRKARLLLEGNIFVREVCVRLFRLLTAEPEDNEDYLTETSIDKWYTFLNSFQSTNSYFTSFSKALNNL